MSKKQKQQQSAAAIEDLLQLEPIDGESITTTLKARFHRNLIYSNIGQNILVTLNPRKQLDSNTLSQLYYDYAKDTSADKTTPQTHLFLFADKVYHRMVNEQQDQSVLFCGESGSGKSENRKLMIKQLCDLSKRPSSHFDSIVEDGGDKKESKSTKLIQNVKKSETILEASELRDHFKSLGIGRRSQSEIFNILAAILHLGNIQFEEDPSKNPNEPCSIKNKPDLDFVADLLGVLTSDLLLVLTQQTKLVRKELCTVLLNPETAMKQRDALASTLYSLLFSWVLEKLNTRLCKDECYTFIGLVDFASTPKEVQNGNSFDQLLLNFANERVMQFIQNRVIIAGIKELKEDLILDSYAPIPIFVSNETQVAFLGEKEGLLALVDVECARDAAAAKEIPTATRMHDKMVLAFSENSLFESTTKSKTGLTNLFTVKHFGGIVEYDVEGFFEANVDTLCPDFVALGRGDKGKNIKESDDQLVRELFSDKLVSTRKHWRDQNVLVEASLSKKPTRHPSIKRSKRNNPLNMPKDKEEDDDENVTLVPTLSLCFQASLNELFETLENTVTWYSFSLNPNPEKTGDKFSQAFVKDQIKHLNLIPLAESRKLCLDYSVVISCTEFLDRFKPIIQAINDQNTTTRTSISTREPKTDEDLVDAFCVKSGWGIDDYAVGTKSHSVYLTESSYQTLVEEIADIQARVKREMKEAKKAAKMAGSRGGSFFGNDADSVYSDFDQSEYEDGSIYGVDSETDGHSFIARKNMEKNRATLARDAEDGDFEKEGVIKEVHKMTSSRKKWVCFSWFLTWWIPPFCLSWCGGMKRKDIQMAWREKVALCFLIFLSCSILLFFIIGLGRIICPKQDVISIFEINGKNSIDDVWVYAYGRAYQVNDLVNQHLTSYNVAKFKWEPFLGSDVSNLFYKNQPQLWDYYCPDVGDPFLPANWDNIILRPPANNSQFYPHQGKDPVSKFPKLYLEYMNQYAKSRIAWDVDYVKKIGGQSKKLIVIFGNVYDMSSYFSSSNKPFGDPFTQLFTSMAGLDATNNFIEIRNNPSFGKARANAVLNCMNNLFYVGIVDGRNSVQCQLSNYLLLASSLVIVLVILVKFLAALQFGSKSMPDEHDKFVILQVPCYTEDADSLAKSLESLAALRYDDKRKLLFIVCDGMIIGRGNDRPTPRIVLDILGVDPNLDPEALQFESLGEGDARLNYGKIYSGLYEIQGRSVPFIVVVKVGKPSERQRPGNRGKRDSQMLMMRFLNRVHFNSPMSPLELELYHHLDNIIGINPSFYEYVLMVDADTEVFPDALNKMIGSMIHDSKIMGLCGETLLTNEKESWITMIQVYEYFISHHLAKAFESLFGSVTCLPGCFCMYRIRSPTKNQPLLVSNQIISEYSENNVNTLHLKNLLHLGEDRYLTTLMMKTFPTFKTTFTNEAQCQTVAPDRWAVLLSQRRRWINSTVHNLLELMFLPELCGFCCFSMRFVVFLDLFSTVVQPAAIGYLGYLIYSVVSSSDIFPLVSVVMLAGIYGLQVIIFIIKRQWAQIMWMIVYILALPIFSFYIPVYSFWHFDDFSWGNTRVVVGEGGKKIVYNPDIQPFDPKSLILNRWGDVKDNYTVESKGSHASQREYTPSHSRQSTHKGGSANGSIHDDDRSSMHDSRFISIYPSHYNTNTQPIDRRAANNNTQQQQQKMVSKVPSMQSIQYSESAQFPSDDEIYFHLKRILDTANLMTVTKRQLRLELSQLFGCDLTEKKGLINKFVEEILKGK